MCTCSYKDMILHLSLLLFLVHWCNDSCSPGLKTAHLSIRFGHTACSFTEDISSSHEAMQSSGSYSQHTDPSSVTLKTLCFDVLNRLCFWGSRKGRDVPRIWKSPGSKTRTPLYSCSQLAPLVPWVLLVVSCPPPLTKRTEGATDFTFAVFYFTAS